MLYFDDVYGSFSFNPRLCVYHDTVWMSGLKSRILQRVTPTKPMNDTVNTVKLAAIISLSERYAE